MALTIGNRKYNGADDSAPPQSPPQTAQTPQDDSAPAAGDAPGEGGKRTQQEVNYRQGSPQRSCGLCGYFKGSAQPSDRCEAVEDPITPFGFCDIYLRQPNPFQGAQQEAPAPDEQEPADNPQEEQQTG